MATPGHTVPRGPVGLRLCLRQPHPWPSPQSVPMTRVPRGLRAQSLVLEMPVGLAMERSRGRGVGSGAETGLAPPGAKAETVLTGRTSATVPTLTDAESLSLLCHPELSVSGTNSRQPTEPAAPRWRSRLVSGCLRPTRPQRRPSALMGRANDSGRATRVTEPWKAVHPSSRALLLLHKPKAAHPSRGSSEPRPEVRVQTAKSVQ